MYHAAGFQQMKLYTLIKPDVAGAIIRRAHEVGMTVTGHVPRAMTLQAMVDSGTDNVAHLPVRGDTSSEAVKQQVRMLAAKHVVIDPTVFVERIARPLDATVTCKASNPDLPGGAVAAAVVVWKRA